MAVCAAETFAFRFLNGLCVTFACAGNDRNVVILLVKRQVIDALAGRFVDVAFDAGKISVFIKL